MQEQDQQDWHQPVSELFKEEKKKLSDETEKILSAWRIVGISSEGQFISRWLLQQVLKPVGPNNTHEYYAGTQDTFKLILELMKPETKRS